MSNDVLGRYEVIERRNGKPCPHVVVLDLDNDRCARIAAAAYAEATDNHRFAAWIRGELRRIGTRERQRGAPEPGTHIEELSNR